MPNGVLGNYAINPALFQLAAQMQQSPYARNVSPQAPQQYFGPPVNDTNNYQFSGVPGSVYTYPFVLDQQGQWQNMDPNTGDLLGPLPQPPPDVKPNTTVAPKTKRNSKAVQDALEQSAADAAIIDEATRKKLAPPSYNDYEMTFAKRRPKGT